MFLNLVSEEKSNISYKINNYPDGQSDIILYLDESEFTDPFSSKQHEIIIKSRFNSFKDLELIICANKALREKGVKNIGLYIPYILGGRSDRKFIEGGIHYLKDIVTPILNAQNFSKIIILDPHSDVIEALINNFEKRDNVTLVKWALEDIKSKSKNDFCIVSPDAGAMKKIYNVVEKLSYENNIIIASKHREIKTGKITHTEVPLNSSHKNKNFIIIDDICDGGRTFIEIAKVIKNELKDECGKIYLIISHGIFSAGFNELQKYFDGIYTTNSIKDIVECKCKESEACDKCIPKNFIKQLNIF